jgi:hypothetical protein
MSDEAPYVVKASARVLVARFLRTSTAPDTAWSIAAFAAVYDDTLLTAPQLHELFDMTVRSHRYSSVPDW